MQFFSGSAKQVVCSSALLLVALQGPAQAGQSTKLACDALRVTLTDELTSLAQESSTGVADIPSYLRKALGPDVVSKLQKAQGESDSRHQALNAVLEARPLASSKVYDLFDFEPPQNDPLNSYYFAPAREFLDGTVLALHGEKAAEDRYGSAKLQFGRLIDGVPRTAWVDFKPIDLSDDEDVRSVCSNATTNIWVQAELKNRKLQKWLISQRKQHFCASTSDVDECAAAAREVRAHLELRGGFADGCSIESSFKVVVPEVLNDGIWLRFNGISDTVERFILPAECRKKDSPPAGSVSLASQKKQLQDTSIRNQGRKSVATDARRAD